MEKSSDPIGSFAISSQNLKMPPYFLNLIYAFSWGVSKISFGGLVGFLFKFKRSGVGLGVPLILLNLEG